MFSIFSTLKLTVKNGKILLFLKFGGGYMEVNYTLKKNTFLIIQNKRVIVLQHNF